MKCTGNAINRTYTFIRSQDWRFKIGQQFYIIC